MRIHHIIILATALYITGCSSTSNTAQNRSATTVVQQADASKINTIDSADLHSSFLKSRTSSPYDGKVVEISGKVIAFSMSKDNFYTVTIDDKNTHVVCIFDDSISGMLGDEGVIQRDAELTIRGQCYSSGLFSSTPFTLDGCLIVKE
tara:strand:- start:428 stop:871 length:444 start_codon:yes stop_codon:yes gene_type:complete